MQRRKTGHVDLRGSIDLKNADRQNTIFSSKVLSSQNGNANIVNYVLDDPTDSDKTIYQSKLELQSITTEYVGRYFCVYNSSVKDDSQSDFNQLVEQFKASSIYIFVDGE